MKTLAASLGALCVLALFTVANSSEPDMRQVQCLQLIIYAPITGQSDVDICAAFGGIANADTALQRPSLTILVKNMPVGGSHGLEMAELQTK